MVNDNYLPRFLQEAFLDELPKLPVDGGVYRELLESWSACTMCQFSSPERELPQGNVDSSTFIVVKSADSFPLTPLKRNLFNQFLLREGIRESDYVLSALYHCKLHGQKVDMDRQHGCMAWLNCLFKRCTSVTTLIVSGKEVVYSLFSDEVADYLYRTGEVKVVTDRFRLNVKALPSYLRGKRG